MDEKIKKKVAQALAARQEKEGTASVLRCPLRCWDIFSIMQDEFRPQKKKNPGKG
ncbi:MAG: hypothetical protein OHK0053_02460 [Microscillaceae bacterium]